MEQTKIYMRHHYTKIITFWKVYMVYQVLTAFLSLKEILGSSSGHLN